MAATFSWLDDFFGPAVIKLGSVFFPKRPVLNLVAAGGTSIDVEDDPINDACVVTLSGDGPGGAVGSIQYHAVDGSDDVFRGADALVNADGGFDFVRTGQTPFEKSGWNGATTTDATPTIAEAITLAAGIGDGFITVHAEVTYYYASSGAKGGNYAKKATFARSSGVLSRVGITDLSPSGLASGTAPGGIDIVANGNNEVDVQVTGIASTTIKWAVSIHVQVAA